MDSKFDVFIDEDLQDIVPGYLTNRNNELIELKKLLESKDLEGVKNIGHKLAGNAGGYGFDELGVFGRTMEDAAVNSDWNIIEECIEKIEHYISNVNVVYKQAG